MDYDWTMDGTFVWFGAAHIVAIALSFCVPLVLAAFARANPRLTRAIRLILAGELIATWVLWYWLIVARSWMSAQTLLPMDLCSWASIAAIVTLIRPNQRSFELAYFWALTGTLQALVTPELFYDFPDLRFIVFFAFHGGAIASVLFLVLGAGMRPYPASIPRVLAASLVYLVVALATNRIFHTNFGYLSAKPAKPSLLDLMGPWPIYIVEVTALGVVLVLILYSPFYIADTMTNRKRLRSSAGVENGKKALHFPVRR
ncbi:MAG TPA: TIGR02206 family membrane protein [Rhizomicrobium sp.]|jgi:hypothetical integral membrane protein (TIGR02206 family)|nr:TIGR02206 family membrane protein [Rhizomicrobium sp.]